MPNFETHIAVGALTSALAVATGSAVFGWDNASSSLAFLAGLSGSMIPDLDSDTSKPLRLSGAVVGLGFAAATVGFVTSNGKFLNRPWPPVGAALAAIGAFFLFNSIFVTILKRRTSHRGLFHSLAVPFLYAGLWAVFVSNMGGRTVMAVWFLGLLGVFSHLILDAGKSLAFNPLKIATDDLGASTRLWLLTALVNFLAFTRMTLP
ncbi:MAG: metal-dependent hydrolase [Deltaproteobacteria bacterium]|nr:metal-dependent hydrolase [Deltaproteobacteria bacterium]